MKFIDRYSVEELAERWARHEVLGPATRTLSALVRWTDSHSDGWHVWPKPARAAEKLMNLVDGWMPPGERCPSCYSTSFHYDGCARPDATPAALKAALVPVKAFRTRQHASFEVTESLPSVLKELESALALKTSEVTRLSVALATAQEQAGALRRAVQQAREGKL